MPQYDHLLLVRAPNRMPRRKTGRAPSPPTRDPGYGTRVRRDVDRAVAEQRRQRPAEFVDPSLILRVRMHGIPMEDDWGALGLTLLSSDDDHTLVLFSSSDELTEFRERLDAYEGPIPERQAGRRYAGFIDRIDDIGTLEPRDRLGIRLREAGFTEPGDFQDDQSYTIDIELWDFGNRDARSRKVEEIRTFIEAGAGEIFDAYIGPSITMVRARAAGSVFRPLLSVPEVAFLDLPPEPDLQAHELVTMALDDLPQIDPVDPEAPIIGILDSGLNAHPLLNDVVVASEGFPEELGTADVWGHGTRVGGVAVFGDLRDQLDLPSLSKSVRLVSAKVITDEGQFYERRTLPRQMRIAIERLNEVYGCRIFVLALGDVRARFERGRVGPWAATLDEIARERDVLILVSSGNRMPRGGNAVEQGVTQYPNYLLEEANRICEPAGAANVVTVGSLSHSTGIGADQHDNVHLQPITIAFEPSPFSRIGPGPAGIVKPDMVDLGGTVVLDAVSRSLRGAPHYPSSGIVTLNHLFLDQLFTAGHGTSYATPMLARRAGQLLRQVPNASANLLRALLVGAAEVPEESRSRLTPIDADAPRQVCGNGIVDPLRAAYSDDHRVVLYAEDELEIDHFAVYRVPIPAAFQTGGRRTIRVSLAFDPPVRRTRAEYLGINMNYRLIRGCPEDHIFEHFRSRIGEGNNVPDLEGRYKCALKPGSQKRDSNTLQTSEVSFSQDTGHYGDTYHLVVRCAGGWAADQEVLQRYAVVVELEHQPQVQLYARVRAQVRV